MPAGRWRRAVADLSRPLADFVQFAALLGIPENARLGAQSKEGGRRLPRSGPCLYRGAAQEPGLLATVVLIRPGKKRKQTRRLGRDS